MTKGQKRLLAGALLVACGIIAAVLLAVSSAQNGRYRVFIGMERKQLLRLSGNYETLVINASQLKRNEVVRVHQKADRLYSYLNVGAVEKSSNIYQKFSHLALKPYENWPDEYWVDVTDKAWQDNLIKQAQSFKRKGIDGLFLDNFDIYYHYPEDKVYRSLVSLLRRFKNLEMPVIVNGADSFISQLIKKEAEPKQLVAGVNQESVFTRYDFDRKKAEPQEAEVLKYYQTYLRTAQRTGLEVFLLEYGASRKQQEEIKAYARSRSYQLYLADSIVLNKEN